MKYLFFCLLMLAGCRSGRGFVAEVSNDSDIDRLKETVSVEWSDICRGSITADNVVVTDEEGTQQPSQIVFDDEGLPVALLFQADVKGGQSRRYSIVRGEREQYEPKVYGRYVPERADDYAWENDLTAYRIYGPTLADPKTQGVDVWVKSTPKLIINEWFARNDYHHNYGEGMDCYKVANTLGGGALAPLIDGKLMLLGNYVSQKCVANGPIRTEAVFEYSPAQIGGKKVSVRRTIRLDAGNRFTVQQYELSGFDGEITVAAGIVMHDVASKEGGNDWAALSEPASDSSDPERDGNISLGVVLSGGEGCAEVDSHLIVTRRIRSGESVMMLNGSGWSQAGVTDAAEWQQTVRRVAECVSSPLRVSIVRR